MIQTQAVATAIFCMTCFASTLSAQQFISADTTERVANFEVLYGDHLYSGTYTFGIGDGWDLEVTLDSKTKKVKAVHTYYVNDEDEPGAIKPIKTKIKNARIDGFIFQGDGFLGVFMGRTTPCCSVALALVKGYQVKDPEVGFRRR